MDGKKRVKIIIKLKYKIAVKQSLNLSSNQSSSTGLVKRNGKYDLSGKNVCISKVTSG